VNKEAQYARFGLINYKAMNKDAKQILNTIGGEHIDPNAYCGALNLEDRKLVEIAKAMNIEPDILIIDETSNALASRGREILYKNIRAVRDRGGAVLFITHDMDELVEVCDRVTIMRDGFYVDTLAGDEMVQKRMKELMVGREIADNYYRSDFTPTYEDEVVLKAEGIINANLNNVSLELHRGEILGIGGLAECGMHELGRVLFGLDKADYGTVQLGDGTEIKSPIKAVKQKISYISKNRDTEAILLNYKIDDNIVLPSLKNLKKGPFIFKKDEIALANKWADELSIKCRSIDQRVVELSGGNKQKVVVAKWLANESKIFIMDCPTRGIDVGVKEAIYTIMEQLKADGCSIIMISEEMPELIGMSDRILVMKDGEISQEVMRSADVTEHQIINYMI
jgi:ribose transport system ATP-binding protein